MSSTRDAVDTQEMMLIHRVVRREVGRLPALLRGAAGDRARAKQVAAHAREMLEFVHVHHSGEDELLWPVLRPRVSLDGELIDRMQAQHAQIATVLQDVQGQLAGWASSADPATGERMAAGLESISEVLTAHLAEEEERILPLVAAHLSPAEWDALGEHGLSSIPGRRRLVILGHILHEADDAERAAFLRRIPPPARVAYRLLGRRQFARELAAIQG